MTVTTLERPRLTGKFEASPLYTDNVIPHIARWSRMRKRSALVTLVGVDGAAPRAQGAQMAVCETGEWAGYISGGCLEQAIALEAVEAIKTGRHRVIRYGKGSPYLDIRLPCGSGLDIAIQPVLDASLGSQMARLLDTRTPFALRLNSETGRMSVDVLNGGSFTSASRWDGGEFVRVYTPRLRCVVIGSSPIAACLAQLAACADFEAILYAPDLETVPPLPQSVIVRDLTPPYAIPADAWTAAVLAFHDHDQELPVFAQLLESECFFIAAIGSRKAHDVRVMALRDAGVSDAAIARIKSPAGLVPGLKNAPHVAVSILAELVSAARERGVSG